ncbi:MAG: mannan endo,4-beta-mannosidase [Bacteroidota bacterium]|nr:mannan endo,4-beta-mannosidase [Bacteroidota bacterium]
MKNQLVSVLISFFTSIICWSQEPATPSSILFADKNATLETKLLLQQLNKSKEQGFVFGHQDDLAYGVHWKYEKRRSDVKETAGDYPGIYGWDIAGIEKDAEKNIDGVPFDKMKAYIIQSNKRGGITTISWHLDNPMTGKNAWDITPNSLQSILEGGQNHEKFKSWLDKAAAFFLSLKDKKNKQIPVIFRPYHELTGTWFWWCQNSATPEEFTKIWKFTADYLQQKGVHNLLYAYSTADFNTKEDFLKYYPGDAYVDILGFDKYEYSDPQKDNSFIENCQKQFKIINEVAQEHQKLIAFTETGYEQVPYSNWWTDSLIKAIGTYKIAYVLLWRNHGFNKDMTPPHMHYYAPYKGQTSAEDFKKFYKLPETFFEKDVKKNFK